MNRTSYRQYKKRPVTIEAIQWDGSNIDEILDLAETLGSVRRGLGAENNCIFIDTLEGTMRADSLDWVIKGTKNELYPCKPDIFAGLYDKVD